jgi:putative ABC transport system permease protein
MRIVTMNGAPLRCLLLCGLAALASPRPAIAQGSDPSGDATFRDSPRRDVGGVPCPEPLELLLERRLAARLELAPGDSLAIGPVSAGEACPARVAGVYEPEADPAVLTRERPRVLLHLPDLARLAGRADQVDRFSLRLRDTLAAAAVADQLEALMPGTRVVRSSSVAARASTTFEVVRRFHRAIGIITITAGGVFLACIMTLKVQERRTHVAALRLVGVSRRTLLAWLMVEAAVVSLVGGLLGSGLGRVAAAAINAWYQRAYDTTLTFALVTRETILTGLGLAVVLGLVAGLVGAARLLRIDALREVGR